ncbi:MAG: PAS domain-containing sensor histidine kinase [Planctomycetes bacterium]|nr:PAS domain-containing sensor histidine kinase [Planctomycetota bacterium]
MQASRGKVTAKLRLFSAFALLAIAAVLLHYDFVLPCIASVLGAGFLLGWLHGTRVLPMAPLPVEPVALESNRDLLDAVLCSVTTGVLVVRLNGLVPLASPLARELLELTPLATGSFRMSSLVPWPLLDRAIESCTATGQIQRFESIYPKDPERSFAVQVSPWRIDGVSAGAVIVLDDQTLLRQLETHRLDFVANVSHELKTPLSAIQGFVETLLDDREMPAALQLRFLSRVAVQTERLAILVSDLLTLSRLDEEMAFTNGTEPVDVRLLVQEVLRDLWSLAERKQVSIVEVLPSSAVIVAGERESLRQIFSNLIDNAIKYTPSGGSVTVRLRSETDAQFEVIDTGIGLLPADQERVFERFYRVDKARSRELGGTGLGLSIVKNTVRIHGGSLGVRSQVGKGSTFWVRLPIAEAD